MPRDLEREAAAAQEAHRERHPWTDTIQNFLDQQIPADWDSWDHMRRMTYWSGAAIGDIQKVPRQKVCVKEIWQECLGMGLASLDGRKAREITSIIQGAGWERGGQMRFGKEYGSQKAFVKVLPEQDFAR